VNVGRLESGVDKSVFVEKIERGENWSERAASLVRGERARREKLAEVFVREFSDDVKAGRAVDVATAAMENAEKAGMRKGGGGAPMGELRVGVRSVFQDELDGGVGRRITRTLGSERS